MSRYIFSVEDLLDLLKACHKEIAAKRGSGALLDHIEQALEDLPSFTLLDPNDKKMW